MDRRRFKSNDKSKRSIFGFCKVFFLENKFPNIQTRCEGIDEEAKNGLKKELTRIKHIQIY